jgi:hypothetical protein
MAVLTPPCPLTTVFLKTGIPIATGSLPQLAHLPPFKLIVLMVFVHFGMEKSKALYLAATAVFF